MVWCIANSLDFKGAKVPINERFPFLEFSGVITTARIALRDPETKAPQWVTNSPEFCRKISKPRYIKTHLPFNLLPRQIRSCEKRPKIIYVTRNPKDVCVSFYHHSKLLEGYSGCFDDFCKQFLSNKVVYAPYWKHIHGFWKMKDLDNVLFIKYEDMKKDLPAVIYKTAKFLDKELDDTQVAALEEHLSFSSMKTNPAVNREKSIDAVKNKKIFGNFEVEGEFIRSGTVGQWKNIMDSDMIKQFDEWIDQNLKNVKGLIL
ncbi:sulfotransferase 1C4-like [Copidosoma floridanum]|uniref:sulfotransferase 1C4-like n=1 Tax=Copidosoma floridanum TaxID=29053 RepID=UPI0006C9B806|nr:sulfotransferase 1C4-like [Copidosoma floridanum]